MWWIIDAKLGTGTQHSSLCLMHACLPCKLIGHLLMLCLGRVHITDEIIDNVYFTISCNENGLHVVNNKQILCLLI